MNTNITKAKDYFNTELNEELRIQKMNLPKQACKYRLIWNDKDYHNFYDRLKRIDIPRKTIIDTIVKGICTLNLKHDGPYILKFTESKFYVSIFLEDKDINVKTILSFDMKLRKNDKVMPIQEVEKMFNLDLSEFYSDGFVNSFYGNLLIEESVEDDILEVYPEYIKIGL